MRFDDDQLQQLSKMFEEQRSMMSLDMRAMMREELVSIKNKLDRLFMTESEDVVAVSNDIQSLKKRVKKLEVANAT